MKQTLFLDPRIRDYVFIPLVVLMIIVQFIRFYITKLLSAPDSSLLKQANLSREALSGTIFANQANPAKDPLEEPFDVQKTMESIKEETRDKYVY